MVEKARAGIVPISLLVILFVVLFLLLCDASGVFAASAGTRPEPGSPEAVSRHDIVRVVSVLESRTQDRKVLEKATDKMHEMNERSLKLMSSLCDKISHDEGTPAADLAYSLLTAMLVLS